MKETVHCPQCGAVNQAPQEAIAAGKTRCGRCQTTLALPAAPVDTNDRLFGDEVLNSQMPVLVDFWAPWCGPCKMMGPVLEQLAAKHAGRLKVVKLNTDQHPHTAAPYGIRSIPAMLLFKDGQVVKQVVGAMPLPRLEQELAGLF